VRFYFTGTEFLYDYNANLSKAVGTKRLPLTVLCTIFIKKIESWSWFSFN